MREAKVLYVTSWEEFYQSGCGPNMVSFSSEFQNKRFEIRQLWAQVPALPLTSCVAVAKFYKLTSLSLSFIKYGY